MELPTTTDESALIGVNLPEREYVSRFRWQYGAAQIAVNHCRIRGYAPQPAGEWQHGWHPAYHNVHPELVIGTSGKSREVRHSKKFWVARRDQATLLRSCGYRFVEAIGLPLVYLRSLRLERLPGSILVMPQHSSETTEHTRNFEEYADVMMGIKDRFSHMVACVHPTCFRRGYWVDAFSKRGIPVVSGADRFDMKSLERIGILLKRFEYMTTNGLGSHLPYSAYLGAKPSIFGPLVHYTAKDYQGGFHNNCPELREVLLDFVSEKGLRSRHPELIVEPWEAPLQQVWGGHELGEDCRGDPSELRRCFGWTRSARAKTLVRRVSARARPLGRLARELLTLEHRKTVKRGTKHALE